MTEFSRSKNHGVQGCGRAHAQAFPVGGVPLARSPLELQKASQAFTWPHSESCGPRLPFRGCLSVCWVPTQGLGERGWLSSSDHSHTTEGAPGHLLEAEHRLVLRSVCHKLESSRETHWRNKMFPPQMWAEPSSGSGPRKRGGQDRPGLCSPNLSTLHQVILPPWW